MEDFFKRPSLYHFDILDNRDFDFSNKHQKKYHTQKFDNILRSFHIEEPKPFKIATVKDNMYDFKPSGHYPIRNVDIDFKFSHFNHQGDSKIKYDSSFYDYFHLGGVKKYSNKGVVNEEPEYGRDNKFTDKELQLYNLQTENGTPNKLNQLLRTKEEGVKLEVIKAVDEEYQKGMDAINKMLNKTVKDEKDLTESIDKIEKSNNLKRSVGEDTLKDMQEEKETVTERKEQIKEGIKNAKKEYTKHLKAKPKIKPAFEKSSSFTEEENPIMKEERIKTIREKWQQKDDVNKAENMTIEEYKSLVDQLKAIPEDVDIKKKHPQLYKKLKAVVNSSGKTTGALKKNKSIMKHLEKYYHDIEEKATKKEAEKAQLKKDKEEDKKQRRPPKSKAKTTTLSDVKEEKAVGGGEAIEEPIIEKVVKNK